MRHNQLWSILMGGGIDWTGVMRRAIPSVKRKGPKLSGDTDGPLRDPKLPANTAVAILYVAFAVFCWWVHWILGVIAFIACLRRLLDTQRANPPSTYQRPSRESLAATAYVDEVPEEDKVTDAHIIVTDTTITLVTEHGLKEYRPKNMKRKLEALLKELGFLGISPTISYE